MRALFTFVLTGAPSMGGAMPESFRVTSPQIREGAPIRNGQGFNRYSGLGDTLSPALQWHHPPQGSRSGAVTVHDLEMPTGGD